MPPFAALPAHAAEQLFGASRFNRSLPLARLRQPRMLWVNPRLRESDPNFLSVDRCAARYSERLLELCAYVLVPADPEQRRGVAVDGGVAIGHADRYGGGGIGSNGGSGRAVLVNGYYVKGVGPTHLIGTDTDAAHASGGAYLEESVRETIFSEIIDAEFPYGAVPTLAIIDTGLQQVWQTETGPETETRVLIVRPMFLRPAHFERATAFRSTEMWAGQADTARVRHMFDTAAACYGSAVLCAQFSAFWNKWAAQLAHSFIHRLSHSGLSTSNVCLNGALVDFGASSALPSWGRASTVHGSPPAGSELQQLFVALRSVTHYVTRYLEPAASDDLAYGTLCKGIAESYFSTLCAAFLNTCGIADTSQALQLREPILRVLQQAQQEHYDILDFTPHREGRLCMSALWSEQAPEPLRALRHAIEQSYPDLDREGARVACAFTSADRPHLYRQEMRYRLKRDVAANRQQIGAMIAREVGRGRRSSCLHVPGMVLAGVASAPGFSAAIFYASQWQTYHLGIEWQAQGMCEQGIEVQGASGLMEVVAFEDGGLRVGPAGVFLACTVYLSAQANTARPACVTNKVTEFAGP